MDRTEHDRALHDPHDHAREVRRFRSRVMALLTLRYGLVLSAAWGFIWGTAVLIGRAVAEAERLPLLWGAAGIAIALAVAAHIARRRLPEVTVVRALLDRHSAAGGLVMAEQEADVAAWRPRMPRIAAPALRWRGGRSWALLLAAGAFLAIAFLTPQGLLRAAGARPLQIDEQAQTLADQIELLEEENIIEQQQAAELQDKLDSIRREARADDPVKTWEAMDHLDRTVRRDAERAAEDALAQTQQLSEAQMLAEALTEDAAAAEPAMSPQLAAEAMAQLAQMMKQMAEQNRGVQEALESQNIDPGQLEQMAERLSRLSPEQLQQLRQAAGACELGKEGLSQTVQRLADTRLVDARMLAACRSAGQCDSAGLAAFLAENRQFMTLDDLMASWCNSPGRGGVNRGRGDAPMTWKQPSDERGARFEEQVLPPASLEALKDSATVAVSLGAPEVVEGGPDAGGALSGSQAGGGSAAKQTVLPRHRTAVQRYFERQ